jgi:hypothetical protein
MGLVCRDAGDDIVSQLYPISGWQVIDRPGKSAFHQTALELAPRNRVDTGLTSEVCGTTAVREAMRLSCFRIAGRLNVPERPEDDHSPRRYFRLGGIVADAARRDIFAAAWDAH